MPSELFSFLLHHPHAHLVSNFFFSMHKRASARSRQRARADWAFPFCPGSLATRRRRIPHTPAPVPSRKRCRWCKSAQTCDGFRHPAAYSVAGLSLAKQTWDGKRPLTASSVAGLRTFAPPATPGVNQNPARTPAHRSLPATVSGDLRGPGGCGGPGSLCEAIPPPCLTAAVPPLTRPRAAMPSNHIPRASRPSPQAGTNSLSPGVFLLHYWRWIREETISGDMFMHLASWAGVV